jgi:hypothetical protein
LLILLTLLTLLNLLTLLTLPALPTLLTRLTLLGDAIVGDQHLDYYDTTPNIMRARERVEEYEYVNDKKRGDLDAGGV